MRLNPKLSKKIITLKFKTIGRHLQINGYKENFVLVKI